MRVDNQCYDLKVSWIKLFMCTSTKYQPMSYNSWLELVSPSPPRDLEFEPLLCNERKKKGTIYQF